MVDMHIHTVNSDGEYSTYDIVDKLINLNIKLFSITDHDNINSYYDMKNIVLPSDMVYVSGIEFSSFLNSYNCHILGYGFDNVDLIIDECLKIRNRRINKVSCVIDHLKDLGIYFSDSELSCIFDKHGTIGRFDVCKILMNRGFGSKSDIYDKYLDIALPTHRSELLTITDVIHRSGGISVLAHPKEIENDYNVDICDIVGGFLECGIDGIEAYNSVHSLSDVRRYLELASKYNLFVTGGSDFHGSSHPNRVLGRTTVNQKVLK